MKVEELKLMAEAAIKAGKTGTYKEFSIARTAFGSVANPAAVLGLIAEVEYLRGKNREHFDACIGYDEELKRITKQRDELLEENKHLKELLDDDAFNKMRDDRDLLQKQRAELLAAMDEIIALPSHPMRKKAVDIAVSAKAKAEG